MEEQIINYMKSLGIDMITNAKNGHPGIVLGAAPIIYTVYANHLNWDKNDPTWFNRDRFVMSAGHGSALLYSTLYLAGALEMEDLKRFRMIDSRTPGHPEYGVTKGVEMSTGPLGQGFASSVGMALGEKIKEALYPGKINYHIYTLCGDGDLMEGISYEAASLAGTWKLNNLIVLYDSNHVSLDGPTDFVFNENVRGRFEAFGWNTEYVENGENVEEIDHAIQKAKRSDKPTLIEVRTVLGKGSILEGKHEVHGKCLTEEDIHQLKEKWHLEETTFLEKPNMRESIQRKMQERVFQKKVQYSKDPFPEKSEEIDVLNLNYPAGNEKSSTRAINQEVMNQISKYLPNMITGSADLFSSTKNYLKDGTDLNYENYTGKNIWFGVREHAMGAILNGLALSGFQVSGSTFLTFSDYLKPAMRMTSLMDLPVTYLFSHDSISIGSDGPTHQPVEQLVSLRSMPNMKVYRPCDREELIGTWASVLKEKKPASIILSKQEQLPIEGTKREEVGKGAYIINQVKDPKGILLATGDEVFTALHIAQKLKQEENLELRVVSMPCMETFLEQSKEYQNMILPHHIPTVVLEASSSYSWQAFATNSSYLCTIDHFGASGTSGQILEKFHYDEKSLKEKVKKLMIK